MKIKWVTIIFLVLTIALSVQAVDRRDGHHHSHGILDNVDIDFEYGSLIITSEDEPDMFFEITDTYELYVVRERVVLSEDQQRIVKQYYDLYEEIIDEAKEIGKEGAQVGLHGAAVGLAAVANVVRLISPDYDAEDLEADIEKKAEKLELKAEELEERAEMLEDVVDEFEQVHVELVGRIPEIRILNAF